MGVHVRHVILKPGGGLEDVMRVGRSLLGLLALGVVIATPAVADEIVYFTNGTFLPVTSHRVEKEMISVELGGNSRMGFPLYMVDKIESAGRNVFLNPTYHPANQAIAAAAGAPVTNAGAHPVTGEGNVPSRYRAQRVGKHAGGLDADTQAQGIAAGEGIGYVSVGNGDRVAPDPINYGDRANLQANAARNGVTLAQPPQSMTGPATRREGLVRFAARQTPLPGGGNPGGNQGGAAGQPPANQPAGPQTLPDSPPPDNPPENPAP
jgi:hypothetical protein